ncbi:UDP-2,4-diacetamido-2,4,6-trideoxy-beta-L-altropyranose hydrolase [Rheinheimera sp. MMS21-TC3]|uniref:UDP-2,4-diacetamido-2,4, 6-trideoxy-beta-L-altropyranose hydrolase n=1 Tax=Rheinheimera sp. MMS21-TC3 TaxID=3072790 RepID=UPI0028C3B390|nr:UDP-2,4-diacetamido-2,4,6-trideoxy-beta-L-altropyranose hydrolase [Rheinheimera sp. MMS21-TC3]WNO61805.1 UDP-2,4-diacetamido-2,4,6-trideoxy-beta-L-altropyranose hydrolase [Rheinheimera sp. MMS21-TC3]
MKVLLRADASVQIGSGHIMRCLTLAQALRQQGAECHFVCQQSEGNLIDYIVEQGFVVFTLSGTTQDELLDAKQTLAQLTQQYQLLVVDHYELAKAYCTALRQQCRQIMVVDDLANRAHDCDILLDQNLSPKLEQRYAGLLPKHCLQLLGPRYALLRQEFYQSTDPRSDSHILIGFGGSDEQNLTSLAIAALQQLKLTPITADIVIGANNPWRTEIEQQVAGLPNVKLHIQCNYMATLMHKARLMLGAGGTSHWERCICNLPGLVVTVAENQQATTAYLDHLGACVWLGQAAEMSAEFFAEQLCYYLSQPALLDEIGQRAKNLVPAHAGTPLVVEQIFKVVARI